MKLEAVDFIAPGMLPSLAPLAEAAAPSGQFANLFGDQLAQVDTQLGAADRGIAQLAAGQAPNLHDVMIRLEKARMSLQLLMQVRNRMLEAYQELSRMQM